MFGLRVNPGSTRWLFCLLIALCSAASAVGADLTASQLARYHDLNAQLRCLICQNRSIAESDAPLAKDLRAIVARQIVVGRTNAQIKQYLVDRYGEWILYDPPFQFATLILWLGPFALLLTGLVIVVVVMRRRRGVTLHTVALDRERLARVLEGDHEQGKARPSSGAHPAAGRDPQ